MKLQTIIVKFYVHISRFLMLDHKFNLIIYVYMYQYFEFFLLHLQL